MPILTECRLWKGVALYVAISVLLQCLNYLWGPHRTASACFQSVLQPLHAYLRRQKGGRRWTPLAGRVAMHY
jgi:hypothetical protein